jgi:hypothetical protein
MRCGRMRALHCPTTTPRRSSHIWDTSTRMCGQLQQTAWPPPSRCDALGTHLFCSARICCGSCVADSGLMDARMLQEHPSSAGSALENLTTDYAGAGIKGRNGIAQALRALAPLLGEPQVRGFSIA